MFTNTYLPHVGGVARSVSNFEEDLIALGHKVLVIAPTFTENNKVGIEGDHVLRVPAIQNFSGSDFSVRIPIPFFIDEKIDAFGPDLIHSHHPYLLGDAAIRAADRRSLPLVFTHHTRYEEYTHYVSSGSKMMRRFVINLSTFYANCCTYVIAPSKSIADLIISRGVTSPVVEIPTGIDFKEFEHGDGDRFRQENNIPFDADVIGHLGRLAPEKNLDFLTKAVKMYLGKNKRAVFLVVGDGPSRPEIEKVFSDAGLSKQLIMAGKKTGKSLYDAYAAMDLFVFSSKSETQGLVVVEAMAAKTPVVALDASGVREVVRDNYNGRLLPADASKESFSDAIAAFFDNKEIARAWQANAWETGREFDRMVCARKLVELYEMAMQQKLKVSSEYSEIFGSWENLLHTLRIEWNLLSGKISAVAHSVQSGENND